MATTEESNPPDLLSSVSIDQSSNSKVIPGTKEIDSSLNIEDAELVIQISNLQCPFMWKPEDSLKSFNWDKVEEVMNINEVLEEVAGFKLRRFVIHLISCYTNFFKRLPEKSLYHLDEIEKMLLASMKNRSQDVYFTQINDALFHILHSCRVFMLYYTKQNEKAQQVLQKITSYDQLNVTNQAGIWAVRANLYVEFGYEGIKAAIQYIEKATKLDDKNAYWHFTRGMYLGRLRRIESGMAIPSMEEIASLELSMKLKNDSSFMAFAAEVYVETANRSKKKYQQLLLIASESEKRKLTEKNDQISKHAAELFKKSVELNGNSSHLLFRCGKGMLKLAQPYQDVRLAHEYLKKGLEISYESSFGNHAMALYYMKHKKNYDMAKKYLIKATESKNFGADIDLIRVNFLLNQDPEELLDSLSKLFDRYDEKVKHQKIIAEIISFYLFINYNLTEAIKYMNKLLYLIGDNDDIISIFKSGILRQRLPVSLLEILLSDITDRSNRGTLNNAEQEECRNFMQGLCFQNVNLPRRKNENLRKKLMKEIKANFKEVVEKNRTERISSRATEKPITTLKDYNPIDRRFGKEYASKYYENEPIKREKTVVDEFFEKYEASLQSNFEKERNSKSNETLRSDNDKKCKEESKVHPVLQQLFSKVKKSQEKDNSSSESESDIDAETINRIAKRLDLHLSVSTRSEISKKLNRPKHFKSSASASGQSDDFDVPSVYSGCSSRNSVKQSKSEEKYRGDVDLSYERFDSRERHQRRKKSHINRSPSTESRYSNHHSRRRRSSSSDERRSLSRESRKASRRRSPGRESTYLVKSSRDRSTSRGGRRSLSRDDRKPSRRRSHSREGKRSINRERRNTSRRRSHSRDSRRSVKSSRGRSSSRERRSVSRNARHLRKRSSSREKIRKRSNSRETVRSYRKTTHKRRSRSKESVRSSRNDTSSNRRSISRDSCRSSKGKFSRKERSISQESRRSSKTEHSQKERSISKESHRTHKESHESSENFNTKHDSHDTSVKTSDLKTLPHDSNERLRYKERSRSRESRCSSKRSSRSEHEKFSRKNKKYESEEDTVTELSDSDIDHKEHKSKHRRSDRYRDDDRDYQRKNRRRNYSSSEIRSARSRRSSSEDSRRSKKKTDRGCDDRKKHHDSSSEESSSDSSLKSSRRRSDKLPKSSHRRKSSCDDVKVDAKKDYEKLEQDGDNGNTSRCSSPVEKLDEGNVKNN